MKRPSSIDLWTLFSKIKSIFFYSIKNFDLIINTFKINQHQFSIWTFSNNILVSFNNEELLLFSRHFWRSDIVGSKVMRKKLFLLLTLFRNNQKDEIPLMISEEIDAIYLILLFYIPNIAVMDAN